MEQNELLQRDLDETSRKLTRKVYQLGEATKEQKKLRKELTDTRRRLVEMTDRLAVSEESLNMMKKATDMTVFMMKDHLFSWLSSQNQLRVNRMLRFYNKEQQVKMMSALLSYVVFGEKTEFTREVERWHFKIICGQIEEDAISLPAHSLMVKLFKKYDLFASLDTITDDQPEPESEFRPFDQEF